MKILLTGFNAFGGESINPALEAVKKVKENINGAEIIKIEVPTVFKKSIEKVNEAIVAEMQNSGIPSSVSNTAGTFVCNHIMYGVLYAIDKRYHNMRGGFIHVPFIPSQVVEKANIPYMELDDIVKALELSIKAVVENNKDIKICGGKIY